MTNNVEELEVNEDIQLDGMIDDMFTEYMSEGFELNTDMTFDEVFKTVFADAVRMSIDVFEVALEEEEDLMDDEPEVEV